MRKLILIISVLALSNGLMAQSMHYPLADEKLMHYGGMLGVNIPSYILRPESIYSPSMGYGLVIGGYVDVRLSQHLNLRVSPNINFNYINIRQQSGDSCNVLVMPIALPVHLKWSAERKMNYRPYVVVGGGVSYDMNTIDEEKKKVLTKKFNYFVEGGFGCDFYTKWCRCSPELKYQLGFNDMLAPKNEDGSWGEDWMPDNNDFSYMNTLNKMLYHQVSLVIHFGSL